MNTNTQVVAIDFHGQNIIAIQDGNEVRVAMKPIVEAIALDWKSQYNRIKRHPVLRKGMVIMTIPSDGGPQETATLPLKMLNGWLFGIDATRVKPESRDKLIEYQAECFDVLSNYFMHGAALNPRMQYSVNASDSLTKEQADVLRDMLTSAANRLPKEQQGVFIMRGWSKLKAHFQVSYRDIPQNEFTEAVSLISRHVLTPDLLDAEPAKIEPPTPTQAQIEEAARKALTKPGMRFFISFNTDRHGEDVISLQSIPEDAMILPTSRMAEILTDPGVCLPTKFYTGLSRACMDVVERRAA